MKNATTILMAALATANISAFNDQGQLFPKFGGDPSGILHGSILAANDANFEADHLSQPLSDYIVGAPDDEGLLAALEAVAPSIPTARSFTYRVHNTAEQFQSDSSDDADIREIGGDFGQTRRTGTQADGRTDNKGLIMVLDNDQGGEEQAVQQRAVTNLRNRLLRSDLRRALVALDSIDTNNNYNVGASNAAADIDGQVISDVDTGGDARGVDSNIVVIGKSAAIKRKLSYRRQDTAGSRASLAASSPEEMAGLFGVDRVVILPFRYQSGAAAKAKVLGDVVFSYFAKNGAMPDDPSNIKRFVTNTPSGLFRVYIVPQLKKTLVCVEHYSRIVATSSVGVQKITVTYT